MKRILLYSIISLLWFVLSASVFAKPFNAVETTIKSSELYGKSTISVSVKNIDSGENIWQYDSQKLLHPASTLKAFTVPFIFKQLGNNYYLKTSLYKDIQGKIYLKLSGDPYLTSDEVKNMLAKSGLTKINSPIIIDTNGIDDIEYGIGWMWDDQSNSLMPKYSAYNLDKNLFSVKATISNGKAVINCYNPSKIKIVNNLKISSKNNVSIERKFWRGTDELVFSGTISQNQDYSLPVRNPKEIFLLKTAKILEAVGISSTKKFVSGKTPQNAVKIAEVQHSLKQELKNLMKNSDNLAAESLFKLAGCKTNSLNCTTQNSLDKLKLFYSSLGIDFSKIEIEDASGVSRNDLISVDWMTSALVKFAHESYFSQYLEFFPKAGVDGTMKNRLKALKGTLYAKTGTNAGISGLTGYYKASDGKTYAFAVLIQNYLGASAKAKTLEDSIIRALESSI